MSPSERIKATWPSWNKEDLPEVAIRHRSGSVSSRRAYPVAKNDRFVPPRTPEKLKELTSVGEGNDVYLSPEQKVDPLSEEAKDRIKRIRNIGGGASVLLDQQDFDLDNKLRTFLPKVGTLVTIDQGVEEINIGTIGANNIISVNIDGFIGTTHGVVDTIVEGRRGTTGKLTITRCGASPQVILEWKNGQIISQSLTFDVGDCSSTATPGS